MPKLNPAAPFKPVQNIPLPHEDDTPLGKSIASGVPGAAKAPNLQGSRPQAAPQAQTQPQRLQPNIGWRMGVNLAAQNAISPVLQQDLLNRRTVTATPFQTRTAADHALTRMTNILSRLVNPPVPCSIKKALGL